MVQNYTKVKKKYNQPHILTTSIISNSGTILFHLQFPLLTLDKFESIIRQLINLLDISIISIQKISSDQIQLSHLKTLIMIIYSDKNQLVFIFIHSPYTFFLQSIYSKIQKSYIMIDEYLFGPF